MIQVKRKDPKESFENLYRRFYRRVVQSNVLGTKKQGQYFERDQSKRERRSKAILRRQRKEQKLKKIKLGIR